MKKDYNYTTVEWFDLNGQCIASWELNPISYLIDSAVKNQNDVQNDRCQYCGCLTSSFDVHCASCGAPL